ncbi:MAG TPA: thioredoxin domain-containing protein [Polyangiaceae bacterium]|nr:thioredoxin domain-containing protein [Polyangiaceae bacterium]
MLKTISAILAMAWMLAISFPALAQTPTCDALQGPKKAVATAVLTSQHPYECCDDTIQACLQQKPVCLLARRLANDVCRRAGAGQSQADIERALARRATSMTTTQRMPIDTSKFEPAGAADAKVQVTGYVCARCPFCSRLLPALHQSVTQGALKDKARLHLRLFPIRTHEGSTEGGLALVASQKLGKFWPLLLHLYRNFDGFDAARLPEAAEQNGMNRDEFVRLMNDPASRELLTESKKEGVRNKVGATPTFFINGRPFSADLDMATLQDVIEEEHDRLSGRVKE